MTSELVTFVETYAEWTWDTHRHVEAGEVVYDGTPEDCTICAHPIQRVSEDDGATQPEGT